MSDNIEVTEQDATAATTTIASEESGEKTKTEKAPTNRGKLDAILKRKLEENLEQDEIVRLVNEHIAELPQEEKRIKHFIIPGILNSVDTDEIVRQVHEAFPGTAKTGAKDVAYYRSQLRGTFGLEVTHARPAKATAAVAEGEEAGEATEGEGTPGVKTRKNRVAAANRKGSLKAEAEAAEAAVAVAETE